MRLSRVRGFGLDSAINRDPDNPGKPAPFTKTVKSATPPKSSDQSFTVKFTVWFKV